MLNRDLITIFEWTYQWKMQRNPDITKQAIQVVFSQERDKSVHPSMCLNKSDVVIKQAQNHFGMILDSESREKKGIPSKFL